MYSGFNCSLICSLYMYMNEKQKKKKTKNKRKRYTREKRMIKRNFIKKKKMETEKWKIKWVCN